jgi:hypothetical protein
MPLGTIGMELEERSIPGNVSELVNNDMHSARHTPRPMTPKMTMVMMSKN